ncbi:hypothetical protein RND81_08G122200 [Saponaria officinalis]|uniref:Uncharacterized protein n=1 Tax=Saponaria officinalis TaxID=3572 RepID=A0AAW1J747_SAPOF
MSPINSKKKKLIDFFISLASPIRIDLYYFLSGSKNCGVPEIDISTNFDGSEKLRRSRTGVHRRSKIFEAFSPSWASRLSTLQLEGGVIEPLEQRLLPRI